MNRWKPLGAAAAVALLLTSPWGTSTATADEPAVSEVPVPRPTSPAAKPAPPPAAAEPAAKPLRYVPRITAPIYNESPYITTEAEPIYMYNAMPGSFFGGGHINVVALQLRYAVTDRFALIATKDGWADIHFADRSPLKDDSGFANVAFGFKYAALYEPESESFITIGLRYEAPSGNLGTSGISLQGGGDGFIDGFVTASGIVKDKIGLQASLGYDGAIDTGHDTSFFHMSVHGDYEVVRNLFGIVEFNMMSAADEGDRTDAAVVGSFEGIDLVNFGNTDPGTVISAGFGARYRISDHVLFGVAYELPLGGRKDIMDYRVTTDLIIHL